MVAIHYVWKVKGGKMAMKLNITKFSGGGTATARRKAQEISDKYADSIDKVQSTWENIDEWAAGYASGAQFKKTMTATAEFLNNIPTPEGNNVNNYLQERTDKIINDANYQDRIDNEGQAQVSNPFQQQSLSCSVNVPDTRAYQGIEDFTGLTDEGVANIDQIKSYISQLSQSVDELLKSAGQGAIGSHVTGMDLEGSFTQNLSTNTDILTQSINEFGTEVDNAAKEQESAASNVQSH